MIRTLELSREIKVFTAVIVITSLAYLAITTREPQRSGPPLKLTPVESLEQGKDYDLSITLITADARDLACASDTKVGDLHCGFTLNGRPWKDPEGTQGKPSDVLVPYMTHDNVLFLIAGLWQEPALEKRLKEEPYEERVDGGELKRWERDQLRRFTATCKVNLVEKMETFKTRWELGKPFGDGRNTWVGKPRDCKIAD